MWLKHLVPILGSWQFLIHGHKHISLIYHRLFCCDKVGSKETNRNWFVPQKQWRALHEPKNTKPSTDSCLTLGQMCFCVHGIKRKQPLYRSVGFFFVLICKRQICRWIVEAKPVCLWFIPSVSSHRYCSCLSAKICLCNPPIYVIWSLAC